MSLRKRISLIFLLAAALIMMILYTTSHFFILNSFIELEDEKERDDMKLVLLAVDELRTDLVHRLNDYTLANKVQAALSSNNPNLSSYFTDQVFLNNTFTSLLLLDKNFNVFFQKKMHLETKSSTSSAPELLAFARAEPDRLSSIPFSAIYHTDGQTLFIALKQVKDAKGNRIGTMLLSRDLDSPAIKYVRDTTRLPVEFEQIGSDPLPEKAKHGTNDSLIYSPIWIKESSKQTHFIYTALHDYQGKPAAFIRFEAPRDIYLHGRKTLIVWVSFLIAVTFLLIAIGFFILNKFIFSRLHSFMKNVSTVRRSNELSLRIPVKGDDEISKLEREFNRLLASVEQSRTQIVKLAYEDSLTRLPNRSYFFKEARNKLIVHNRTGAQAAVLFLDLDGFKQVNDQYGHKAGDALLRSVARRLLSTVRDSTIVSRFGGDEFVLFIPNVERENDIATMAARICKAISEPISVNGQTARVSASVGISVYPENGTSLGVLISHADHAMFDAKNLGKNQYAFYREPAHKK